MRKCNLKFRSDFAKFDDLPDKIITVGEYAEGKCPSTKPPRCIPNNHELIFAHGSKIRPDFRHKHECDVAGSPMTDWHLEWQRKFPITEQPFPYKEGQLKDRRADIVLPTFKRILEIQHSKIESGEVMERMKDYALHGHTVTWILHGQECILQKSLGERIILEFTSNPWLYESFLSCETVYYDIDDFIYKVNPSLIKANQIDVSEPIPKQEFIEALKLNKDLWEGEEPPQCFLYLKQQGAGSGKTYGMMQFINSDPEISNFRFITFITKQHAAVHVMFSEFMDQYTKGLLPNIELLGEPVFENKNR